MSNDKNDKLQPMREMQSDDRTSLILLVEDDVVLAQLISTFLIKNGFKILHETNGLNVFEVAKSAKPNLILLDVMLPGLDGLSICRGLREFYTAPILMLTALNDDIDEVAGLEMGADGYLGKPIKPRVLLAHIRAQLRRYSLIQTSVEENKGSSLINAGCITINSTKRQVWNDKIEIELTAAEFDLLWLLAENKGKIIDRESLHWKVFGLEYDGFDRNIDIRISKLRKKLGDDSKHSEIIKTVRGKGYILVD